jgi:hypothetical protein
MKVTILGLRLQLIASQHIIAPRVLDCSFLFSRKDAVSRFTRRWRIARLCLEETQERVFLKFNQNSYPSCRLERNPKRNLEREKHSQRLPPTRQFNNNQQILVFIQFFEKREI